MSCFRGVWQSLNFYKEYLFGFEDFRDLIYAQLVKPKEKAKLQIASYDHFNIL